MFYIHSLRRPDVQIMEYDTLKFIFILAEKDNNILSGRKQLISLLKHISLYPTPSHIPPKSILL